MDTSEEYIEMCRKATEIQRQWTVKYGDFVYSDENKQTMTIFDGADGEYGASSNHVSKHNIKEYKCTWLPRQDQLQDMYSLDWITFDSMCKSRFAKCVAITNNTDYTKEQIGLMIVMKDNYNKEWNGSGWVKE